MFDTTHYSLLTIIFLFILGASIGSFLNVLSDRLPKDQSINGRSHCEHCRKTLSWLDLFPIISFLYIRGRCRYCKKKLSWMYPISEIMTGLSFVSIWYLVPSTGYYLFQNTIPNQDVLVYQVLSTMYFILIISILIAILLSDFKYQIIPDQLVIALAIVSIYFVIAHPLDSLLGAIVTTGIIGLIFAMTKGKGMGFGDVKFAVPMGLILGAKSGFLALYLAFMIGGIVGIALLLFKLKKIKSKIAFGPFLIVGMIIMLFLQKPIYDLIDRFYSF